MGQCLSCCIPEIVGYGHNGYTYYESSNNRVYVRPRQNIVIFVCSESADRKVQRESRMIKILMDAKDTYYGVVDLSTLNYVKESEYESQMNLINDYDYDNINYDVDIGDGDGNGNGNDVVLWEDIMNLSQEEIDEINNMKNDPNDRLFSLVYLNDEYVDAPRAEQIRKIRKYIKYKSGKDTVSLPCLMVDGKYIGDYQEIQELEDNYKLDLVLNEVVR